MTTEELYKLWHDQSVIAYFAILKRNDGFYRVEQIPSQSFIKGEYYMAQVPKLSMMGRMSNDVIQYKNVYYRLDERTIFRKDNCLIGEFIEY